MSLRDNLQIYNTENRADRDLLDLIFKKVSSNYVEGATNFRKIKGITEAFNNFQYVIMKFEFENEIIIDDIKRYIIGCCPDQAKARVAELRMKEWGLFFDGIGIEPSFRDALIERYRRYFVVEYVSNMKKKVEPMIYLEYLLFVRNMSDATQVEQIKIFEELKAKDNCLFNIFSEYIINEEFENTFNNRFIDISQSYKEKFMQEEFLLKTIKDLYHRYFCNYNYNDYVQDISKIYSLQGSTGGWLDINKLKGFIPDEKTKLLNVAHLLEEIREDNNHLIRLTETGISLAIDQISDTWESDKYFNVSENEVFVPISACPILLSKYLLDRNYIIKERDFLIIFEQKSQAA